jgi:hypothetical protein
MMGHRQKLKTGDEVDQVIAPHMYIHLERHSSEIKRGMRRRERREAKEELRQFDTI